jgi:protocatechuate 3,4-dioxygenase beta subunit
MTDHRTDHAHAHDELEDHDLGLSHDLPQLLQRNKQANLGRRGLLGILGGVGAVALVGCVTDSDSTSSTSSGSPSSESGQGPGGAPPSGGGPGGGPGSGESDVEVADGEIPEETAGSYPGDGSNGVNVLTESGVVRSDITSSFGSASGVAEGVPVTVKLRVHDLAGEEITPLAGAAVYLWHCDREGNYSMYSEAVADENYLRGVQETDSDGRLEFTSIFPACYAGRWPHLHFEVYESLDSATTYTNKLRTSQLALPQDACEDVYDTAEGYDVSVGNLADVSLDSDGIFSDGYSLQMATVTGSVEDGYEITLNVPV